ncbi:MAG TPA: S8 family serine peptidase, partial [Bryobacteraceae bacterium]|nr:S8 family serine peptidase [Bryobacteraceae bacterium]
MSSPSMLSETSCKQPTSVAYVKLAALFLISAALTWSANRPDRFALILDGAPLAAEATNRKDLRRLAVSEARGKVLAAHNTLRAALAERKIRVTGANQTLANVVFIETSGTTEADLLALPGVAYVEKLRPMELHLNRGLELMNVPAAWGLVNGEQNAGAGVKIGILDSGIDHTHPAFRDDGFQFPAGFPKCQEVRGECAYTNRKIIAARSYVNMLVGTDPETSRPDDLSPRDRVGHGTAVAMIAAGVRNTGPATTVTGVAPKAYLGNYKVFGSPGVNGRYTFDDVLLQAIEDAVNDDMDIITVSLGAPAVWGPRDSAGDCSRDSGVPCDWRADAIEQATRLGLVVVMSAGNNGSVATTYPSYNSIQTPGTAPAGITVGASTNRHLWRQSLRVPGSGVPADVARIRGLFGDTVKPNPSLTAPLRDVAKLDNDGKACTALTNGSLNGAIALIERGDCTLVLKLIHAQRAGAVGAVIYQQSGIQGVFPMQRVQEAGIPAMLIGNTDAT